MIWWISLQLTPDSWLDGSNIPRHGAFYLKTTHLTAAKSEVWHPPEPEPELGRAFIEGIQVFFCVQLNSSVSHPGFYCLRRRSEWINFNRMFMELFCNVGCTIESSINLSSGISPNTGRLFFVPTLLEPIILGEQNDHRPTTQDLKLITNHNETLETHNNTQTPTNHWHTHTSCATKLDLPDGGE